MIFDDDGRPADYPPGGTKTKGTTRIRTENRELFADRYLIVKELGKGGMGRVFLATDTKMNNIDVAIKTMHSVDPVRVEDVKRKELFIREATIAASLHHTNIVPVIGFDIASSYDPLTGARKEIPYIVMEYVKDGFTLAQELRQRRKLSLDETIAVLKPIAEALDCAHAPYGTREGIVHRDVKPDNIILQRIDGKLYARLLDFGISKPQSHGTGVRVTLSDMGGTRAYMAPERLTATCPPTVAQDVYSFAATAYECLVGKTPVADDDKRDSEIYASLERSWREGSLVCPYPESVFARAVMKGLSLNPDDRPKSCMAFFDEENGASQKAEGVAGFSGFTFTLDRDEFEWNGAELTPSVNVEPGGRLVERRDFALEYENNKDVGEAKVAVVGKYRYRGCVEELSFRIVPRQMSKASVADIQPCEYVGKQVFPAISVSDPDRGEKLEQGRDYEVKVLGNGMAGTAEVEVDGRDNYRGKVKKTFQILRRDIANATVLFLEEPEYNGHPVRPKIAIRDNGLGRDLCEGEDYSVKYGGEAENEGRLTVVGRGNYDGTFGMPFVILPRDIVKATVELSQSVRFDGHPISTLSVKVQDSELGQELKGGVDYRVECRNANAPGMATVCVRGIGRYRGELSREFRIEKGRFDVAGRLTTRVEYDGKPHGIDVSVRDAPKGVRVLYSRSQTGPYATEPITMRDACGETQIWFRVECEGFESYSGFGIVEIRSRNLDGLTIRPVEAQLFVGGPVCPKVTVLDPDLGVELVQGRDFELQPRGSGNVGTSSVTVVGMGNYGGKIECLFTILPKCISSAEVADIPVQVYDGSSKKPEVSVRDPDRGCALVQGRDYSLAYSDETCVGVGSVRIVGKGNYSGDKTVDFQIAPRGMSKVEALPIKPVRYEGHPIENVDVELRDVELGCALKRGKDYEVRCGNADRPGKASAEIVGLGAYRGGTLLMEFEIQEGEFDAPEVANFSGEYDRQPRPRLRLRGRIVAFFSSRGAICSMLFALLALVVVGILRRQPKDLTLDAVTPGADAVIPVGMAGSSEDDAAQVEWSSVGVAVAEGRYAEAKAILDRFATKIPNDHRSVVAKKAIELLDMQGQVGKVDRADGFGRRIDKILSEVKEACKAAMSKDGNRDAFCAMYAKIVESGASLMRLDEQRNAAVASRAKAEEARKLAKEANAEKFAKAEWVNASNLMVAAAAKFEKMEFEDAGEKYWLAAAEFERSANVAKETPKLHVIATVDGKEVKGAKLNDGKRDRMLPVDWTVDKGSIYGPYKVSYEIKGQRYEGVFDVTTVNWLGAKTIKVELHASKESGMDKRESGNSFEWPDVGEVLR